MNCREFRKHHVAFVDDLLSGDDMDEMRRHILTCDRCARNDVRVRRSLMLVRNLPTIECSADFAERLSVRLAGVDRAPRETRRHWPGVAGTYAALAAGLALAGYLALEVARKSAAEVAPPAPAVASLPADATPLTDAAVVAAVPTGVPVWSAMFMVGQLPTQFANVEMMQTALTR